jgi:hypothetical protein
MNQKDLKVNGYVFSILQYLQFLNTCCGVENQNIIILCGLLQGKWIQQC